jgi:aminoglycoside phosphotransferase
MTASESSDMQIALAWARAALGRAEPLSDHSKVHGGHASTTRRLRTPAGPAYLKVHTDVASWHSEVHGYEAWARAFGDRAPRLLAVRDTPPLALILTELPGRPLEHVDLPGSQERAVWRAAGAALRTLHDLEIGPGFGACRRDGALTAEDVLLRAPDAAEAQDDRTPWGPVVDTAPAHIAWRFGHAIERAVRGNYIDRDELATLCAAHDLIPAFAGEPPVPCHRDYCAANLLVDDTGAWSGVIDFEFARWDVRVADFARDPDWAYVARPDLYAAFLEGYGRAFSPREAQQRLVAHAEYALGAILWGRDHAFYGFEREGHAALAYLDDHIR